jgi:hypothetical protein
MALEQEQYELLLRKWATDPRDQSPDISSFSNKIQNVNEI